jgi:hypothetical protein
MRSERSVVVTTAKVAAGMPATNRGSSSTSFEVHGYKGRKFDEQDALAYRHQREPKYLAMKSDRPPGALVSRKRYIKPWQFFLSL